MFNVDFAVLSVPNVEEWQAGIRQALAAALPAVGEAIVEHVDSCFENGVDPWGTAWAPLADSTLEKLARKAAGPTRIRAPVGPLRQGQRRTRIRQWTRARSDRASRAVFGKKILIDRGFLRMSIHWSIEGVGGDAVVRVAVGGPAAEYAFVHQWGTVNGDVPARPYLPIVGPAEAPVVQLPPALEAEIYGILQLAIDQWVERQNAAR